MPSTAPGVAALERALRSRNRLLEEAPDDRVWLDAIEREVAELGIAVAAARQEAVERLSALILATWDDASPFPFATLALEGEIDALVAAHPAVDAEDRYRAILREGRARDRAAGRTLVGPQASDLAVRHGPKDIAAGTASTGEQKALLVGLVLAQARLVADDVRHRAARASRRGRGPSRSRPPARLVRGARDARRQVWMTGADPALFAELEGRAALLHVAPGRVGRLSG